jgi:hypothetical protein
MRALAASQLLNVWEEELTSNTVERALSLLVVCTGIPREELAQWSIGRRDANLLTLRELTFGSQLVSVENCPLCNEQLELNFDVCDVRVEPLTENGATLALQNDNYNLLFRLPDSRALQAIAEHQDAAASRYLLLEQCLIEALYNDQTVAAADLPKLVVEAIAEHMAEADPGANIQLDLCCIACEHRWQRIFDIVSFFWEEIDAWAQRLLTEVHILARAYGWREADILNMHPHRRRFYVEKLGA